MSPKQKIVMAVTDLLNLLFPGVLLIYFIRRVATQKNMIFRPLYLPIMVWVKRCERAYLKWNSVAQRIRKTINIDNKGNDLIWAVGVDAIKYAVKDLPDIDLGDIDLVNARYYRYVKRRYLFARWISKPLYGCTLCMASIYGTITWLVFVGFNDPLKWVIYCMCLSGLNWFIEKHLTFIERPGRPKHLKMQSFDRSAWVAFYNRKGFDYYKYDSLVVASDDN